MEENKNAVGKFIDPDMIISSLVIEPGCSVADFGCGPGYFSIPFAKAVGSDGKVFSLDVLPQALETVSSKAKNEGILNIETKRVNLEKENGSKLGSESVDWVILKDILFQNQNKEIIIREANRILKKGGKAIIVEWNTKESMVGPALEIRIPQSSLENIFSNNGFIVEKTVEAGDFHYAFVAVKS